VGIRENGVETNEGDLQFQRLGRRQKKVSSRPVFGGKIAAFSLMQSTQDLDDVYTYVL
jgi:hypothetical protein